MARAGTLCRTTLASGMLAAGGGGGFALSAGRTLVLALTWTRRTTKSRLNGGGLLAVLAAGASLANRSKAASGACGARRR